MVAQLLLTEGVLVLVLGTVLRVRLLLVVLQALVHRQGWSNGWCGRQRSQQP